jgi:hypothetical protein
MVAGAVIGLQTGQTGLPQVRAFSDRARDRAETGRGPPGRTIRGMGETQRHHVTLHPSPELQKLLAAIRPLPPESPPADPGPDLGPQIEHWTFHDPRQACDVVAFLDPQNQIRHVPAGRAHEVPQTWRRVFIEVRE